jgi:hypothetical protein
MHDQPQQTRILKRDYYSSPTRLFKLHQIAFPLSSPTSLASLGGLTGYTFGGGVTFGGQACLSLDKCPLATEAKPILVTSFLGDRGTSYYCAEMATYQGLWSI